MDLWAYGPMAAMALSAAVVADTSVLVHEEKLKCGHARKRWTLRVEEE
jgi:hypothetical protein